jgi:hypothetical protein
MGAAENPPEYAGLPTVAGSHVPSGKKVSRSFDIEITGKPVKPAIRCIDFVI